MNKQKGVSRVSIILIIFVVILVFGGGLYYLMGTYSIEKEVNKQAQELEEEQNNQEKESQNEEEATEDELNQQEQEVRTYVSEFMEKRLDKSIKVTDVIIQSDLADELKGTSILTGMSNPHYESYEITSIKKTADKPASFEVKVKIDEYSQLKPVSYFTESQQWVDSGGLTKYKIGDLEQGERTNY